MRSALAGLQASSLSSSNRDRGGSLPALRRGPQLSEQQLIDFFALTDEKKSFRAVLPTS